MQKCHTQVVQVHLQPYWCNSLKMCAAAGNHKNSLKTLFWGFKIIQGHRR